MEMTIYARVRPIRVVVCCLFAILCFTREAWSQDTVGVLWTWTPNSTVSEAGFNAYSCPGTCTAGDIWSAETDAAGNRVTFGPCSTTPCTGTYQGTWAEGATYSFRLTAFDSAGNESAPSNIVTRTRPLPSELMPPTLNGVGIEVEFRGIAVFGSTP